MSASACYQQRPGDKDYSVPLHVDCSVEYELPDCAKPPQGVKIEPLLMIHPCHFRNLERQRRRPFENNLPGRSGRRRLARAGAAPYAACWEACRPPEPPSCQALAAWGWPQPRQPCYEAV